MIDYLILTKNTFILQGNDTSQAFSYFPKAIIAVNEILTSITIEITKLVIIEGLTLSEGLIG